MSSEVEPDQGPEFREVAVTGNVSPRKPNPSLSFVRTSKTSKTKKKTEAPNMLLSNP